MEPSVSDAVPVQTVDHEHLFKALGAQRPREQEPLAVVAVLAADRVELILLLDALGQRPRAAGVSGGPQIGAGVSLTTSRAALSSRSPW